MQDPGWKKCRHKQECAQGGIQPKVESPLSCMPARGSPVKVQKPPNTRCVVSKASSMRQQTIFVSCVVTTTFSNAEQGKTKEEKEHTTAWLLAPFPTVDVELPIDVVGMKSYMDSLFDPINLTLLQIEKCPVSLACSKTREV